MSETKIGCVQHDCDECKDLRAKLADAEAKLASAEPVYYALRNKNGLCTWRNPSTVPERQEQLDHFNKGFGDGPYENVPLFTTPQPAPDVQAAVAAALEKAAALCGDKGRKQLEEFHEWCKTNKGPATCYGEIYIGMEKEINSIPRDTSALDEYKADIKTLVETFDAYWENGSLAQANKACALVVDMKDKHNL